MLGFGRVFVVVLVVWFFLMEVHANLFLREWIPVQTGNQYMTNTRKIRQVLNKVR